MMMMERKMCGVRTLFVRCIHLLSILALVAGEPFFQSRNHSDQAIEISHENEVKNQNDAKFILSKYGYLRCRVVNRNRIRREASSSIRFITQGDKVSNYTVEEGGGDYVCNDEEVHNAISEYQRTYNLPVTGKLDQETKSMMSTSRCGNKDEEEKTVVEEVILDKVEPGGSENTNMNTAENEQETSTEPKKDRIWKRSTETQLSKLLKREQPKTRGQEYLEKHLEDTIRRIKRSAKGKSFLLKNYTPKERKKRSVHVYTNNSSLPLGKYRDENGNVFNKHLVRWRILNTGYSTRIPFDDQRATIILAFRMWSEVIPLEFAEDTSSDIHSVDIEIAFGKGSHQNCKHDFDGNGGEIAHSWDHSNMHFDDAENFKSIRSYSKEGIYLLRVAVHEIGHVLGLVHTNRNDSIMYAIYQGTQLAPTFELSKADRQDIQTVYGTCKGRFDTVFDWVRKSPDHQFIYNTYFFRNNHYWMYENYANRTRYGDPLYIAREWEGVPNNIDGYVHVWLYNGAEVIDDIYFFKGEMYYKFNNAEDRVFPGWPRRIQDDFGPKVGSPYGIPSNLDSVFFDPRDKNIYFFKNEDVYIYDPIATGDEKGCCVRKSTIAEEFPPAEGHDPLPGNLDAVYYSYRDKMMYFLKGETLWKNIHFDPRQRRIHNRIEKLCPWNEKFSDICDIEASTEHYQSSR